MTEEPLTDAEIKTLRELVVSSARTKWAVAGVRQVCLWVTAIAAGWLALKGFAAEMFGVPR